MSIAVPISSELPVRRPTLLASLGKTPWAVADQMLISATNFVTIVLLARGFSQASLGSYTLVYSALLFVNSIQSGLVTQPHNILGATRRGDDYARYTTSTAVGQLMLLAAATLLVLAGWSIALVAGWQAASLLLALAPAMIAWQLQEFARRALYTEGRVAAAFANDLLSYGGQAIAIAALWWNNLLTGPLALYAMAASSALGAAFGAWQIRASLTRHVNISVLIENWHFGKWVAGGELFGHWLSAQLFVYLAAGILGTAAAGILRAVHTVFGPSRVLADVFCTMLPIRFARTVAEGGRQSLHSQVKLAYLVAVPLLGSYCLLVAVAAKPVLWLLYGDKYTGSSSVLALYAASAFVSYMTMIVACALRATRQTRQLFIGQVTASLIAFPVGWLMIVTLGIHGTVLGIVATYLVMSYLLWRAYVRDQDRFPRQAAPEATPARLSRDADPAESHSDDARRVGGAALMLIRIFELLDKAGIPFCVLHGYRSFPHTVPSDVDCIMPASVLPGRLASLLHAHRARIGADIVQWVHEGSHYFVLAGKNPDGSVCLLALDVTDDYVMANRVFYRSHEILQGRRRYGEFWVPSPSVEFGSTVIRRILKQRLTASDEPALNSLYAEDPTECLQQLARFWSNSSATLIAEAARSGDWTRVRRRMPLLRAELLRRMTLRHPLSLASRWVARTATRIHRWIRPMHGLSVVFLGPDGAGKSSVVRAVRQDLSPAFFGTRCRTFPPALLNRGSGGVDPAPHATPPRTRLASVVRAVLYWFVYQSAGHFFTTRADLARCALVLHDRHFVDTLIDPRRYRYSGPVLLLRLLWFCLPKPDLIVLLDAPAELIHARKREVSLDETARQRQAYWRLVSRMGCGRTVDAAQPLGHVVADVNQLILYHLAQRCRRRLGLPVAPPGHAAVRSALDHLIDVRADQACEIEQLGQGDEADVFAVRSQDGQPLWHEHAELVVKLYREHTPDGSQAAQEECESLRKLSAVLDGKRFHGWTIRCPAPIGESHRPTALVMTKVPGKSLNYWLGNGEAAGSLGAAGQAVIDAMVAYWNTENRIYGDLDFNNILCDPQTRTLSFVDPGMPEKTYLCSEVPRTWFPASRDLAYMLFDVAASVRASFARPRIWKRQKHLVETNLRAFMAAIDSPDARQNLLDEIRSCTDVHVARINVSWSPVGLFRSFVRRTASRCVRDITAKLQAAPADQATVRKAAP